MFEIFPSQIEMKDVKFVNSRPAGFGGYGDIYHGEHGSKVVAIKRPRIFRAATEDETRTRKLRVSRCYPFW